MICSVLDLSTSLPLTRIHILTNPLVLPPTWAAAIKKKAPDSLTVTTPLSCLIFFDASVEFIVTTLGLASTASCSSVLEAWRYDVAEAPPTEARSMTDIKITPKIAFILLPPTGVGLREKSFVRRPGGPFRSVEMNRDFGVSPRCGLHELTYQPLLQWTCH